MSCIISYVNSHNAPTKIRQYGKIRISLCSIQIVEGITMIRHGQLGFNLSNNLQEKAAVGITFEAVEPEFLAAQPEGLDGSGKDHLAAVVAESTLKRKTEEVLEMELRAKQARAGLKEFETTARVAKSKAQHEALAVSDALAECQRD